MPRIARSLAKLRDQINARHPERSKLSDGWIGDSAHQATKSDHNPNAQGVVTALDITHDPAHGVDTWRMAEVLRQTKDPRIKYVISNGRIFSSVVDPWQWRPYTGANKHAHHIHVSVSSEATLYDLDSDWKLDGGPSTVAPKVKPPAGITADMRRRMMNVIMGFEGRIPPKVHIAPDGRPEIAGITQKDHPAKYAELKTLLDAGKTQQLIDKVIAYYLDYTSPAQNWTDRAGLEFFLRDCILNRGPTGAAEILQMAVTPSDIDHEIGPTTRGALAALDVDAALAKLRLARERYEDKHYPHRRSSDQWQGMLNRWNNAVAKAKEFQKEQGATSLVVEGLSGGAVAAVLTWLGAHPIVIVLTVAAVVGGILAYRHLKKEK